MSFLSSASRASPFKGALLAAAAFLLPSLSFAQMGPFTNLEGSWAGSGTLLASDGHTERLRCRATYYVSPSGRDLDQLLRCASDSYRFDVDSGLVRDANGAILGTWRETNTNAGGNVQARENGDVIVGRITGPNFTANMTVATGPEDQKVQIVPSGSQIRSVSVEMHRE